MKKYVSLIVCAIITLAALIIPIGSGARYDGEGSGKNQSVKNLNELSTALKGSSATYTFTYSEGLDIERHSLRIFRENYQDETETSNVTVFQNEDLTLRVTDLHSNNETAVGYGRLADKYDFVNYVDMDMNTGIVKIKYQNDNYGKVEVSEDLWLSFGYASASDLGLDTKEATDAIAVYSNSAKTQKVLDIQKGQILILESEEDGVKTIKYSTGDGLKTGYINSSSYKDVYVSSYFDEAIEKLVKEGTPVNPYSGESFFNQNTLQGARAGVLSHGRNYRFYTSDRATFTNSLGLEQVVQYAEIGVLEGGQWKTQYCSAKAINTRVESSPFNRAFTGNYDKGTIKVFQTADGVYAQVNSEMTLAHNRDNIRTTINAEFFLKGDKNLIKINSFFFADESGTKNEDALEFLTGSRDGKEFGQGQIKINEWVDAKDAKIYFNMTNRPADEFINPLNFFVDKYFNADGSLKYTDFLTFIIDSDVLEQNGKQALVKSTITESSVCDGLYYQVFGNAYDRFIPTTQTAKDVKTGIIDIDFSNKKMPVIKTKYIYELPEISIYDNTVDSTSKFISSSDRTIAIENIGNTVIPKVVMQEVKALLG